MNAILIIAMISILYASGGIMYIRMPFTKVLKITITDKPIDIEWPLTRKIVSCIDDTNDTTKIYEDTYFTPYNLAMLFQ